MNSFENRNKDASEGRKTMTIRERLTLAMALLMALSITVFTVFLYSEQQHALMDGVDGKLETTARMAQALLPPNYHDRITGPGSIPDQEYQGIVDRHNRLCKSLGLEYLWSVMSLDGRIVFTSATSPDKEVKNRRHAGFLEIHSNPALYADALRRATKEVQNSHDQWGTLRVVLVPYQDQRGRTYLMGAGMRLSEVDRELIILKMESLGAGLLLFLISIAGIYLLAGTLARPVERLTATIEAVSAGDPAIVASEKGAREHILLARRFNQLNQSLHNQIDELARQREKMKITLESIGDGVIVTDGAGRVTLMNPAAERLTGWPFAEATGKPLPEVFHIIDAQTRQPASDPVARALESGLVAGLAGRTVLIARDGAERQIADSAAPILEKNEAIGVVLVFLDITERMLNEKELERSRAELKAVYDQAPLLMCVINQSREVLHANRAFARFVGKSEETLRSGRPGAVLGCINALDDPRGCEYGQNCESCALRLAMRKTFDTGCGHQAVEYRATLQQEGAARKIVMLASTTLIQTGGPPVLLLCLEDVTDRTKARQLIADSLREKEALLKEVHHRVKNNLQIVSSLLRLQAAQIDHPVASAVLRDMQNRVRTMALLHENLHRSKSLAEINLAEYFHSVCAQLLRSICSQPDQVKLEMDLAPVRLDVNQAVPCGLLLNELVSNSLKHAFPQGRPGVVRVELQPVPGGGALRLCVSDDGVGLPPGFDIQALRTLGLHLVFDLARQLHGELGVRSDKGAAFEVVFTPVNDYTTATTNE